MTCKHSRALLILNLLLLLLFCASGEMQTQVHPGQTISLDSGWEFRQQQESGATDMTVWRPAEVPGMVHTDLLRNGLIPDPYYRDNEQKLQWIENVNWEYRSSLQVDRKLLSRQHLELVFEGLDTCANVYINGVLVLTADNMFREWRVEAKPYLKAGQNSLLIVFESPIKAAAKIAADDPWSKKTTVAEKAYLRKAAYMYGWDWGPRFVSSGIWKPVKLEAWDDIRISGFYVRQRDVTAEEANLTAEVEIQASKSATVTVTVGCGNTAQCAEITRKVNLHSGLNHVDMLLDIVQPALWYPAGYGAQSLYRFTAEVRENSEVVDRTSVRTGLRSIVLRRDPDQWGRSFEFVVNGIPAFAKGANVIPFDSFPARASVAQYRQVLESAREANMNMIRVWGGGYYETQEFYDLCDELGIMVWQDFMLADIRTPGTYAYKDNVSKEAEYQVRRLRNHPGIVLWCGNNETESTWRGWRNSFKTTLPVEASAKMWEDYLTMSSGILARTVERLSPEIPYWPSSPSADGEETSDAYEAGDVHDWNVWHARAPFSEYEQHYPRFMSEFGFQSFPEMRTVESFTVPGDRANIFTPVMQAHQKNNEGNAIIQEYLLRYYRQPRDFASFLYVSQVLQAEAVKAGAEHLRRSRPRSMGALFWQLNDSWPVVSWSSIDYYGRWKALQYYARRFYSDLLVSPHEENGSVVVHVVSDRTTPTEGVLRVRLMTMNGDVLEDKVIDVHLPPLSSAVYFSCTEEELLPTHKADPTKAFIITDLSVDGKNVSSNTLFFASPKDLQLIPQKIAANLVRTGDGYRLLLTAKSLASNVDISFEDIDAKLSDNYFNLIPGETISVEIRSTATESQLRNSLNIVSLVDAFAKSLAVTKSAEH